MEKSSTLFNLGAEEQFNERVRFFTEFLDDDVFELYNFSMVTARTRRRFKECWTIKTGD